MTRYSEKATQIGEILRSNIRTRRKIAPNFCGLLKNPELYKPRRPFYFMPFAGFFLLRFILFIALFFKKYCDEI